LSRRCAASLPTPEVSLARRPPSGATGSGFFTAAREGVAHQYADDVYCNKLRQPQSRLYEIRIEAFNVLNTFNWGNPGTNLNAATFGRVTSLAGTPPNDVFGTPRIMQFGIKYGF
jgi:hypothetical protein